MSRAKALGIFLIVGLIGILASMSVALAQNAAVAGSVTVSDSDDSNYSELLSDMLTVKLSNLPALPADSVYEGWIVSDDGPLSIGVFEVTDGAVDHSFATSNGANILSAYHTFVISVEPSNDSDPAPSDDKPYALALNAESFAQIQMLVHSAEGNPAYEGGLYVGDPMGSAVGLRAQTAMALAYAEMASDSDSLDDVRSGAQMVLDVIAAGPGITGYADQVMAQASAAAAADPDDTNIAVRAQEAADTVANVKTWVEQAQGHAESAISNQNGTVARGKIANAVDRLGKALNGFDANGNGSVERTVGEGGAMQAYQASQGLGSFVFGVTDPPPPPPPDVGDFSLSGIIAPILLAGIALIALGGGALYMSNRRRANTA